MICFFWGTPILHLGKLWINWAKSALLPLDEEVSPYLSTFCPVPTVQSFKYLGVHISPVIKDYCTLDIFPILHGFKAKITI